MREKLPYQMSVEEILTYLQVRPDQGLTEKEAEKRLQAHGWNELSEGEGISPVALFLNQFKDFMVLVLLAATLVSGLLGEYLDAVTIIAILVMNAVLGFLQEFRAEKSLKALKELSAPLARVLREGKIKEVPAKLLVPGDIVYVDSGDMIPADIRFIKCSQLYVEESALTGESVPVSKHADVIADGDVPLGDRKNLGFMGTLVTRGNGIGVVAGTGMQSEMGKIAELIQNTETIQTPLQRRLEQLGKILIAVAILLTVMVVVAGIMHGQPVYGMFLAGVSLAVAAIPEGLPAIVTIALALGVQRMIKRKAIVRKLPSVETLGCASVICSDKTGTLTQNKMTVTNVWAGGEMYEVSGEGFEPAGTISSHGIPADLRKNQTLRRLMQIAVLCSNAQLVEEKSQARKWRGNGQAKSAWNVKGDPTEGALLVLAAKCGVSESSLKDTYKRVGEIPFDSERKRMSVVVEHQAGRLVYTKGAPDVLLQLCSYILWENKVVPLTPSLRQQVLQMNEELAGMALRVLGAAYRECPPGEADADSKLEQNLIFVGLMGMIDPPRKEVPQAIRTCRSAGIKTVMITGDHRATAEAIARRLGMVPEGGLIVDGAELSRMNDDELDSKVENIYVYARVSPEHKLRIVKALQRKGHVVAMTGDGVNDAPAIKSADIGIAMGQSGTDVAKEASALILSDDNFASIVAAIEEGRGIYENIRKFIRYILASNVGEIMTMFIAMMAGMPLPLVPIQILWVNLVTDGLPAMALGVDQPEEDLMRQKPRSATESIFARGIGWKVISRGILIGLCTLAAFWLILKKGPGDAETLTKAQTVAFATLVLAQLIHVFDCRSSRSIFHRNILENKYLLLAVLSSLALLLAVIYIEMLQPIFKTTGLDHRDWIVVFIFAGIPTFVAGIEGFFPKNKRNKRQFRYGSKPMMR